MIDDQAKKKSSKILDDESISDLFGIVLEEKKPKAAGKKGVKTKKPAGKRKGTKAAKPPKKDNVIQLPISRRKTESEVPGRKKSDKGRKKLSQAEVVASAVNRSKKGLTIKELSSKTGLSASQLYAVLHRLKQEGKITNATRGVYIKAG